MKKILYALFLTFLLNACMQHYYVVRTEGTGTKGHYDKDSIVYLTEAYENIEKQGVILTPCFCDFIYFLNTQQ